MCLQFSCVTNRESMEKSPNPCPSPGSAYNRLFLSRYKKIWWKHSKEKTWIKIEITAWFQLSFMIWLPGKQILSPSYQQPWNLTHLCFGLFPGVLLFQHPKQSQELQQLQNVDCWLALPRPWEMREGEHMELMENLKKFTRPVAILEFESDGD